MSLMEQADQKVGLTIKAPLPVGFFFLTLLSVARMRSTVAGLWLTPTPHTQSSAMNVFSVHGEFVAKPMPLIT